MAKPELVINKEVIPADVWIGRLTDLLRTLEAMTPEERSAALAFAKSKYRSDWPSENY
jgi:hypothetical protein